MIDEIIEEIDKNYKKYNKPIIASERCQFARKNETMGESRARRDGFLSGLLTAKSFVEKQQNMYPNYRDLLYKYDSCTTELQIFKEKEDRLRELLKNNTLKNIKCDCNCLRNFVGNIEQILNDKVVE